jgi:hypothetical protein
LGCVATVEPGRPIPGDGAGARRYVGVAADSRTVDGSEAVDRLKRSGVGGRDGATVRHGWAELIGRLGLLSISGVLDGDIADLAVLSAVDGFAPCTGVASVVSGRLEGEQPGESGVDEAGGGRRWELTEFARKGEAGHWVRLGDEASEAGEAVGECGVGACPVGGRA